MEATQIIDGIEFEEYEEIEGLSLPVGLPPDTYEGNLPLVVRRDFLESPDRWLSDLLDDLGQPWDDSDVTEGRTQKLIEIDPTEYSRVHQELEPVILAANEEIGLDLRYWNSIRLNRFKVGDYHEPHSDYTPGDKLAFSLILQDADEGGEFLLHEDDTLGFSAGDFIIFSSFLIHSVEPVVRGERISLTGWLGGPPLR